MKKSDPKEEALAILRAKGQSPPQKVKIPQTYSDVDTVILLKYGIILCCMGSKTQLPHSGIFKKCQHFKSIAKSRNIGNLEVKRKLSFFKKKKKMNKKINNCFYYPKHNKIFDSLKIILNKCNYMVASLYLYLGLKYH